MAVAGDTEVNAGARIMQRCDALAELSEDSYGLTRTFGTSMHRHALELIGKWMSEAGMNVRQDAAGNLIGRYEAAEEGAPCIMMGSHQDSVRDAGKYDGPLGIVAPIEAVSALARTAARLPVAIEVIAFTDEEGTRFQTALLGSRAVVGTLDRATLCARDRSGITLAEAMREFGLDPDRIDEARRRPHEIIAFVETHIEQGPRLQDADQPLGVVTGIAGASRLRVGLSGQAGHAGTVPMDRRRDAMCAAAEMVLACEDLAVGEQEMVATVGQVTVGPGAINVIPGEAAFAVDLRAPVDADRERGERELIRRFEDVASRRGVGIDVDILYRAGACASDSEIMNRLAVAVGSVGGKPLRLVSGAGHDAMAMAGLVPMGMLFVRCKDGISHNPAEEIRLDDADMAARALVEFLRSYTTTA